MNKGFRIIHLLLLSRDGKTHFMHPKIWFREGKKGEEIFVFRKWCDWNLSELRREGELTIFPVTVQYKSSRCFCAFFIQISLGRRQIDLVSRLSFNHGQEPSWVTMSNKRSHADYYRTSLLSLEISRLDEIFNVISYSLHVFLIWMKKKRDQRNFFFLSTH